MSKGCEVELVLGLWDYGPNILGAGALEGLGVWGIWEKYGNNDTKRS